MIIFRSVLVVLLLALSVAGIQSLGQSGFITSIGHASAAVECVFGYAETCEGLPRLTSYVPVGPVKPAGYLQLNGYNLDSVTAVHIGTRSMPFYYRYFAITTRVPYTFAEGTYDVYVTNSKGDSNHLTLTVSNTTIPIPTGPTILSTSADYAGNFEMYAGERAQVATRNVGGGAAFLGDAEVATRSIPGAAGGIERFEIIIPSWYAVGDYNLYMKNGSLKTNTVRVKILPPHPTAKLMFNGKTVFVGDIDPLLPRTWAWASSYADTYSAKAVVTGCDDPTYNGIADPWAPWLSGGQGDISHGSHVGIPGPARYGCIGENTYTVTNSKTGKSYTTSIRIEFRHKP